jgi:hypothetical protein
MFLPNHHSFRLVRRRAAQKPIAESLAVDTNKRTFLRLAGVLGLGVAAASVLPKQAEASGTGPALPAAVGVKNHLNTRIDPVTESGNLQTIATNVPALGWNSMDGSLPVALASNQPALAGKLQDGSGNAITSTASALNLNIKSGDAESSYTEGETAATATGTLALSRSGFNLKALKTDPQGVLNIDDLSVDLATINGEQIDTTGAPGVLPTMLVDTGGDSLETSSGTLQVQIANPKEFLPRPLDVVINGSAQTVGQCVINPIDVSGYATARLQVGGTFTATYNFEGSNNMRNNVWAAIPVKNLTLGTFVISNTVAGQYEIPLRFKYFRVRISAFTSGIPQARLLLSPLSSATNTVRVGHPLAGADGLTANVTAPNVTTTGAAAPLAVMPSLKDQGSTTYDLTYGVVDGTNSDGTGIRARGLVAQVSEVPIVRSGASLYKPVGTIITEKQFGNVRMSPDRSLNVDIKDADGSGLGVNLTPLSEVPVESDTQLDTLTQILDATNALHDDVLTVQPATAPLTDKYNRYVGVLGTTAKNIGTANVTVTGSTSETTLVTGTPGKYAHIRSITFANTDPTNSSRIDLRDATGGIIVHQWQVPSKSTQSLDGGKGVFLPQTYPGNSWTITCGTAASSILASVTYEVA